MKKEIEKIKEDKEIMKSISKISHYSPEDFLRDVKRYIKAISERRMLCIIKSVSASGMSRTLKFNSCEGKGKNFGYQQYWCLFKALGYTESRGHNDAFSIGGCGMDMIFHTNYTNIHRFHRLGLITKEQCDHLAQQTPVVL